MQVAAQARACVDCPTLQVVGPQSCNQALKAIAIARTFLKESNSTDICIQPAFMQLDDGHTGILVHIRKKFRRTTGEAEAQQLKAASGTDAKVLAGAISSFAREGRRMCITAIGAGATNQAVKAVAIARKNVEEEAIDIMCKPEFTEVGRPAANPAAPPHPHPSHAVGHSGLRSTRSSLRKLQRPPPPALLTRAVLPAGQRGHDCAPHAPARRADLRPLHDDDAGIPR